MEVDGVLGIVDAAREFFIRNQDRILFGSDQAETRRQFTTFFSERWYRSIFPCVIG